MSGVMTTSLDVEALRKTHYNATIGYVRRVNNELMVFRVQPEFPLPAYKAGQYTSLGLGYWEPRLEGCQLEELTAAQERQLVKRAYSISSSILGDDGRLLRPEDENFLEFYVVLVREAERRPPALTPRLFALEEGSRLFVTEKITGHYTLDPLKEGDTALFLSTGTGEAPHNKMTLELLRRCHTGTICSVVCVRYQKDLAYLAVHEELQQRYSGYRYIALTTREEWNRGQKLYIQDLITSGKLEEQMGRPLDPATTHVFLCGNPKMIGVPQKQKDGSRAYPEPTGVIEILEKRGFRADQPRNPGNVHFEEYW